MGLCASLVEADLPGLTPEIGAAIGTVFDAATAWIVRYWIRRIGREPEPDELEPITRADWQSGERVTAAAYVQAIEDLQRFARRVADFLTAFDVWRTPTMSTPPPLLGEIASTPDEPMRAAERGGLTVKYPAVVANIIGNPAMSVPLCGLDPLRRTPMMRGAPSGKVSTWSYTSTRLADSSASSSRLRRLR